MSGRGHGRQITIGHYGDCRRPDPARYIHRYDMSATLNGRPVNLDNCPACGQYIVCAGRCWDERTIGHLAEQSNRAETARQAAELARQRRTDHRFTAFVCLVLVPGAALCLWLYLGGR